MEKAIIYHNPRCSKSRQALQLLLEKQIQPKIIEYLKTPLTVKEIGALLELLAIEAKSLVRTSEPLYKELHLGNPKVTAKQLILAMAEHPILIERPIVVINNKAVIARPPEKLLEII